MNTGGILLVPSGDSAGCPPIITGYANIGRAQPSRARDRQLPMAISFKLGTFSAAGCAPFGALVVAERALAFSALPTVAARAGLDYHSDGSTLSVLDEWERNYPTLQYVADSIGT